MAPFDTFIYTKNRHLSLPVLLYFHGGGWALGSLDAYDTICQLLAAKHNVLLSPSITI